MSSMPSIDSKDKVGARHMLHLPGKAHSRHRYLPTPCDHLPSKLHPSTLRTDHWQPQSALFSLLKKHDVPYQVACILAITAVSWCAKDHRVFAHTYPATQNLGVLFDS
eukprot:scaffold144976_cov17-Tisochrysis_lutea.AAC.1